MDMKKISVLIIVLLLLFNGLSFSQLNKIIVDSKRNIEIAYGECTEEFFKTGQFSTWFMPEYESYVVKKDAFTSDLRVCFDSIYVFIATWCSDTKRELPRFCKIIDELNIFGDTSVKFFAVDSEKITEDIDTKEFYLQYVPTFIFYFNGQELCRIVEEPRLSLEEDIVDLLKRIN